MVCCGESRLAFADKRLRCHHCGFEDGCHVLVRPAVTKIFILLAEGMARLEEWLQAEFPEARVLRVDRDWLKSWPMGGHARENSWWRSR